MLWLKGIKKRLYYVSCRLRGKIYPLSFFVIGLLSLLWFEKSTLIAGGSFNWPVDFVYYFKDTISGWRHIDLFGNYNVRQYAYLFPYAILGYFFQLIFDNSLVYEKFLFYTCFSFSGFSMYILARRYGISKTACFLAGLFYMFSPFALLVVWYLSIGFYFPFYSFLPLYILLLLDFLENRRDLCLTLFFLTILPLSITFGNPTFLLLIVFFFIIYFFYHLFVGSDKLALIKKFAIFFIFYFLINLYWISPLIFDLNNQYVAADNQTVLQTASDAENIKLNSFKNYENFRNFGLWSFHAEHDGDYYYPWHGYYLSKIFIIFSFIIPLILLFSFVDKNIKDKKSRLFWVVIFIIFFTLNALANVKIGTSLALIIQRIPFLERAFRGGGTKYGFVYTLAFSMVLAYGFDFLKKKFKYYILVLAVPIMIIGFPFITGDVVYRGGRIMTAYLAQVPKEYFLLKNYLQDRKLNGRGLVFPTAFFYSYFNEWNAGYSGTDYLREFTKEPIISTSDGLLVPYIYKVAGLKNGHLPFVLDIFNIKNIIYRADYNVNGKFFSIDESLFSTINSKIVYDNDIFTVSQRNSSWPHIYIPDKIINCVGGVESLVRCVGVFDYDFRPVIYFSGQNKDKSFLIDKNEYNKVESTPHLEFEKINSTKYRLRIHQTSSIFPLVFSENYHNSWKVYVMKSKNLKTEFESGLDNKVINYKILANNEDDQATKLELEDFIKKGFVSTLGDGSEKQIKHKKYENGQEKLDYIEKYNIDFISKNFQGTIQNNNLPKGKFYETWLAGKLGEKNNGITQKIFSLVQNNSIKQLPEENHLTANGYANSWLIETDKICSQTDFCVKNPDGTYDFELVVEFWSQRLFYIGLFVSGITLFGCLGYLMYDILKKRGRGKDQEVKK